jgi:SAM-dependent methyltransferase
MAQLPLSPARTRATPVKGSAPRAPLARCPACSEERPTRVHGWKGGFPWVRCPCCASLFVERRALIGYAEAELYERQYQAVEQAPPVVTASIERLVRSCEPHRKTGRWLDLGFGQGDLLEAAAAQGWECFGTELARPALERGAARGWIVGSPAECDERFPPAGFDVVTMIEIVEHVVDPTSLLSAVASWLRPGGVLYLTTPHAGSLNWRILGMAWTVVAPPAHLTLWSTAGLARALTRAGLQVRQMRTEGLNPAELVARLRRLRDRGEFNRAAEGAELNTSLSRTAPRRLLKRLANEALSLSRLGDTIKAWASR